MRLNGARFTKDKTGVCNLQVPWEVHTLEECESFSPSPLPLGLPITGRSAEEFEVGTWHLTLTHEGQAPGDANQSLGDESTLEIELDTSMSQDPLKSHPNWEAIALKYGFDKAKDEFPESLPSNSSGGTAFSGGGSAKPKRNPLHGTDSYLSVGAIFRLTFAAKSAPADSLEGIGTVFSRPPGWQYLGIPHPRGRDWLKLAPKVRRVGNTTSIVIEYMLSGPNGWIRDIYGAAQLNKGNSGGGSGLTTGGLTSGSL